MVTPQELEACRRFLAGDIGRWPRLKAVLKGNSYSILRRLDIGQVDIGAVFWGALRVLVVSSLATVAVWLLVLRSFFDSQAMLPIGFLVVAAVAIVLLRLADFLLERRKGSRRRRKEQHWAIGIKNSRLREVIVALASALNFRSHPELFAQFEPTRARILQIIAAEMRALLAGDVQKYLEVSLLVFTDDSGLELRIANRAEDSRPIGTRMPASACMAYHVALSGKSGVLHDLRESGHPFGRAGYSQPRARYRSILCIPLIDRADGAHVVRGVVTIDSEYPYVFWQTDLELVTRVHPFIEMLCWIMRSYPYALKPPQA
jgi:hypothetical protein